MRQQFEYTQVRILPRMALDGLRSFEVESVARDQQRWLELRFDHWRRGKPPVAYWWVEPTFEVKRRMQDESYRFIFRAAGWFDQQVPPGTPCIEVDI